MRPGCVKTNSLQGDGCMGIDKIVVVGGVAGGASAAARARRLSEKAEIVLVERGPDVSFANCGLPYYVGGEISERRKLLLHTPETMKARLRLDVRVRTEAIAIDRAAREVVLRDLDGGREYREPYDALVLATGAAPIRPPIPGIERPGHFTVRSVPDVDAIDDWIEKHGAATAVVVGGGYIGLEMAEQLVHRGLKVSLAEVAPQVMAPLDPEMAEWVHAELRRNGVDLHLRDGVASFDAPSAGESAAASVVVLKSGVRLPADIVILGLGVRPETSLARDAGLEIGELGGVRVDQSMRTSDEHIWAVGDVVEVRDMVTGRWSLVPLAGPANRQGRIAADSIFGHPSRYRGTLGSAVLRVFSLTVACTGASEKTLAAAGIACEATHLHNGSHAGYYPGAKPIALKVIYGRDGKLLGAQAAGEDGVEKRIDVLATAIMGGMDIDDIAELELCYAPPFGSAKDPVNMAGMAAQNVLSGLVRQVQWHELAGLDAGRTVVVDVRDPAEREAGCIPGSLHIPLPELRQRIGELPRDKEVVVSCQSGQRSYFASRILEQHGFTVRNLTGSYRTWKAAQG